MISSMGKDDNQIMREFINEDIDWEFFWKENHSL